MELPVLPVPLRYWSGIRAGLYQALDQITDEQLTFSPAAGLWSLGQVALHIAAAEEGWFRYIITRELNDWPEDFPPEKFHTVAAVTDLLQQTHGRTEAYLASIDYEELERVIEAPWEAKFPVRWAIWHVLEHEIHHRGEIFIILGMLGKEAPDV